MRAVLIFLFTLGLLAGIHASNPPSDVRKISPEPVVKAGRIVKVLAFLLDQEGRDSTSPSLFDRDAYQFRLRQHAEEVSALRYDVLWSGASPSPAKFTLRLELRGVGESGVPHLKNLEAEVVPGNRQQWTNLTLGGDDLKKFGSVVAWRATLWDGAEMLGEQKSFLW